MIFNSLTGDPALDLAIMDSDNKRHILESLFEKYISLDFDPNEVQEKVYQEAVTLLHYFLDVIVCVLLTVKSLVK